MANTHFLKRLCAAAVAAGGLGGAAQAQAQAPKAETVLARVPAIPGVAVSNPAPATCKVEVREWEANKAGVKPKGVIVTDADGRKVRQFIDTTGKGQFNILSYYTDGVESFREVDTDGNGVPDLFRWLGPNGGKQGAAPSEKGVVEQWTVLSAEEAAHEVFAAVRANDPARLRAVLATAGEVKALGLPAAEEAKLLKRLDGAGVKLAKVAAEFKLTDKAKLSHVELDVPHTTPRDALTAETDLVRHKSVAVLLDAAGDGKEMKFLSAGEMVQVGRAWKMVDGPAGGLTTDTSDAPEGVIPEAIRDVVAKLAQVPPPKDAADMPRYHLARAELLEQCVEKTKGAEQLPWLKQLIDSYAAAVEADPTNAAAMKKFTGWNASIGEGGAGETKAYSAFRYAAAEYAVRLKAAGPAQAKIQEAQDWRRESLEGFVKAHPTSADAPEALMQLAIAAEFASGKNAEATAREWYAKLVKDYAGQPHATKAAGAIKRLDCDGKAFELSGQTLDGKAFTEKDIAGKPAVVVWWASWGTNAADDLKALAKLQKEYEAKGLAVVTVSLDDDAAKAAEAIRGAGVAGYHLHAAGGLDRSPLAAAYGIHGIPHVFLIGKDGKVANRAAQSGAGLKEDVEKLLK